MPGVTAWMGLLEYCAPKAGETVLVSAASGAVGGVVGQLAKLQGCRAVGIAGGAKKCEYAVKELGFDACVDYKAGKLIDDLKAACPNGVDALFENVGGEVLDASFRLLNPFSRVALCGLISDYNRPEPYGVKMIRALLVNAGNANAAAPAAASKLSAAVASSASVSPAKTIPSERGLSRRLSCTTLAAQLRAAKPRLALNEVTVRPVAREFVARELTSSSSFLRARARSAASCFPYGRRANAPSAACGATTST
jgi:hypothetical protein